MSALSPGSGDGAATPLREVYSVSRLNREVRVLLERVAKQPVIDIGRWTRDELYKR